MMSLTGFDGLAWGEGEDGMFAREWLRSKATSIEGGTSEIMLNIIAKNILDMKAD